MTSKSESSKKLQRLTLAAVLSALSLVLMATIRFPIFPAAPFYEMEFSDVPIILLTAKAEDMDKLLGFEHGADDYLTKPFNILELKARIRALLRRAKRSDNNASDLLTIGSITLDLHARNAYHSGQLADLTAKEFDMIELLMRNPNRVYSREALLDTLWAFEYRSEIRTVDVHIRRLREKLEKNPAEPQYILTKWGVGYYFKK